MKVYIIKHKNYKTYPINLHHGLYKDTSRPGVLHPLASYAFLKKKDAQKYIEEKFGKYPDMWEIVTFQDLESR